MTKAKVFETVDKYFDMLITNDMNMQQVLVNGELMKMIDFIDYIWNLDDKCLYKLSFKMTIDSDIATIDCSKIR